MHGHDERRQEPRHVVVGIEATLDDAPCMIVDISRSAVRLLRPAEWSACKETVALGFALARAGGSRARTFRVIGHLVRTTELEIIYRYTPPTARWETLLRAHDSFLQTKLTPF